ncbi:MAG: hypothetical protein LUI12_10195 [Clostridiales bacterium]|nr:hypothetical protein [Clostridiales bacterium]
MNCCIILCLLWLCSQNGFGCQNGSGCQDSDESGFGFAGARRGERDGDPDSCSCNESRESRFEPRFEGIPFSGSTCGCEEQ